MKTLIIYNTIEEPLKYLLLDGDYSRFDGVIINSINGTGFESEFVDLIYHHTTGILKHDWTEDKILLESKNWDKVAICTWLP